MSWRISLMILSGLLVVIVVSPSPQIIPSEEKISDGTSEKFWWRTNLNGRKFLLELGQYTRWSTEV